MKFGTAIPEHLLMNAVAERREKDVARVLTAMIDAGFSWFRVGDHIAHPGLSHHAGEDLDNVVYGDPFSVISWLSLLNADMKFVLGVLVLPLRHPVLVAHGAATADRLSAGRLLLGMGSGYAKQELAAVGIDYKARFAMTEDHLHAVRGLLDNRRFTHRGRFTQFEDVALTCRPAQSHVPIWIGGVGPQAADRAARLGDCWFLSVSGYGRPPGLTPRDLSIRAPALQARRRELGLAPLQLVGSTAVAMSFRTDPRALEGPADVRDRHVNGSGTVDDLVALLAAYRDAGLEGIVMDLHTEQSLDDCLRAIDFFAERVRPKLA